MMALLTIGMGLTSCDEQLDNAVTPVVAEVTSIEVDLSKIDEKYLDTEKTKLQLTVGDEVTLSFTILPEEMASTEVELTSADATILSIDGLKVKALKEGETKVTAKAGEKTAECTVTVKAAPAATDLSKLTGDYTAKDGETLTGTLNGETQPYKITIAAGATVTLSGATINGVNNNNYKWAGITCEGDATIILKDGSTNTLKGFYDEYPGIFAAADHLLTIKGETLGTGKLTASSNGYSAGIGGTYKIPCGNIKIQGGEINATGGEFGAGIGGGGIGSCGNIEIQGGTITATGNKAAGIGSSGSGSCGNISITGGTIIATGGQYAAGIGSGAITTLGTASCGNISITGGTITATGGERGAGIGSGREASCGTITIANTVTRVTATKGNNTSYSIGMGYNGSCGTVTIGCTLDNSGNPVGGTTGAISTSPYTYDPNAPVYTMAAAATESDKGKLICTDGHIHVYGEDAACTAGRVAKIIYVGTNGHATYTHGLALALNDEGKMKWGDAIAACSGKNTSTPVTDAEWLLASKDQWDYMLGTNGAGSYTTLRDGFTCVGGSDLQSDFYWSSTEYDSVVAWFYTFYHGYWSYYDKGDDDRVRACLAF